ncbi:MAG TPA: hypothetical protein VJQ82_22365 [Terriglobales bacterium]|nr:hypothetical protein [Terriglobales bacterium]
MALLPDQIAPETVPIGKIQPDGSVRVDHNWYLLFYNLTQQTLGNGQSSSVIDLAVTASPFTYQPTSDGIVIVEGGTVSDISINRSGVTTSLGIHHGQVALKRLDSIIVTYAHGTGTGKYNSLTPVAPTMQFWPS